MKRLACHLVLCCGIAGLAPAGLAEMSNTNSSGVPEAVIGPPAPASANAVPAAAANLPAPTETNSTPAALAETNSTSAPPANTNTTPAPPPNTNSSATLPAGANSTPESEADKAGPNAEFEITLDLARQQRRDQLYVAAAQSLEGLLKTNAPTAIQRAALFELALVMQDDGQPAKAQQVWAQYLHLYADDPTAPDVLLRQGLLFRKMGVDSFAISKFYAVMSSALKLKQDNLAYYKKLVVQAQTEIADTYFLDAKFEEASDFYNRILKSGDAEDSREQLEWKLIRSLSYLTNDVETIGKAQSYLTRFPKSSNVPEVRFLLACSLKNMKRDSDALQQVLLLLQSQQENAGKDPETWAYWQRRAGNEIANQLYKQGDYASALEIYLSLAELDTSPAWQAPVWYQAALAYEQLQQWQKAADTYTRILDRQKELTPAASTPALAALFEMAQWRKDYIAWMQKANLNDLALRPHPTTNTAGTEPRLN
jgi:tetratricopeptide (TPR) repeat protein